jgi:predicted TIM-barrel fold metal-dependent hydrolase
MKPMVIDVHSHLYPQRYVDFLRARSAVPRITGEPGRERFLIFEAEAKSYGGRPIDSTYWEVGEKLSFMEHHGIDQSVISVGNPWLDPIPIDDGVELARQLNDDLASLEAQTGGRLCGLGVLPPGSVPDAVAVAKEIVRTPTLHGVITGPRPCGRLVDDRDLDPLWRLLNDAGLPVFLHPHYGAAIDDLGGYGHAFPVGIAFPFETTIALARLIFGGVLVRFPDLRIMAAHGGGTAPYLAGRLDAAWRSDPSTHERLPDPPSRYLAKLGADAVLYHPRAMRAAADLVGTQKLMFGTDHPFSVSDPAANLEAARSEFKDGDLANVMALAARSFFSLPEVKHPVSRLHQSGERT